MRLSTWQFCPLKRRRGVGIGMKKNASPAGIDLSQTNNEWRGESLEIFTDLPHVFNSSILSQCLNAFGCLQIRTYWNRICRQNLHH